MRQEQRLRQRIQQAKAAGTLTPDAVAAFAALHIVDDHDLPITPAAHHRLWLRLMCDMRIRKLLIIAPPASAKTTWTISAFIGAYIGFWPENNVIISSASGGIAKTRSISVRLLTQSPQYQATFPDVQTARGLSQEVMSWSLAPNGQPRPGRLHPTLSAYGAAGPINGSRADLVVADDLLDFENSRTAHMRGKIEQWVHNSMLARLKPSARIIIIGTAWHHDDIYAKARRDGDWVVCHTPLLSAGPAVYANLTYPDDWPYERLGEPLSQAQVDALLADRDGA